MIDEQEALRKIFKNQMYAVVTYSIRNFLQIKADIRLIKIIVKEVNENEKV